jgi:uncharacterized tellurite resistance protein B-like protein
MTMLHLVENFQDNPTLQNLTADETEAFVDLLIYTVLADGTITEEELDSLADQWGQLPFAGDDSLETLVGEYGYNTREYLEEHVDDQEALDAFLAKTAARIKPDDVREAALRMIALVSLADGVDQEEVSLCYQLGALFGWSEDQVSDVVEPILNP